MAESTHNDGGPAFPVEVSFGPDGTVRGIQTGNSTGWHEGMSLRAHFAGQAMLGMLSCQDFMNELTTYAGSKSVARKFIAEWSVKQADALLAELAITAATAPGEGM